LQLPIADLALLTVFPFPDQRRALALLRVSRPALQRRAQDVELTTRIPVGVPDTAAVVQSLLIGFVPDHAQLLLQRPGKPLRLLHGTLQERLVIGLAQLSHPLVQAGLAHQFFCWSPDCFAIHVVLLPVLFLYSSTEIAVDQQPGRAHHPGTEAEDADDEDATENRRAPGTPGRLRQQVLQ